MARSRAGRRPPSRVARPSRPASRPTRRPRACQRHDLSEFDTRPRRRRQQSHTHRPKLPATAEVPHRHARGPRQRRRHPDQHPRQVRVPRILLQRRLRALATNEVARQVRRRPVARHEPHALAALLTDEPEAVLPTKPRHVSEVAPGDLDVSRRVDVKHRMHVPRAAPLWFPRPRRERETPPHFALARESRSVVNEFPTLRDIARPGRQRLALDSAAEPSAVPMRPKMGALPLVPRQLLRTRRSDRRQHHRHARSLQRLEQHSPPVPRPNDPADLAGALLARLTTPASRAPLPLDPRPRRDTLTPAHRRPRPAECSEIHTTTRAANAGRRLRTALDTNRTPAQQLDPTRPDQRRLTPVRRRRNPLLIAVVPGQSRPPRNHHHLALQAGGRRFEPGTPHNETRCKRRVSRFRGGNAFPCGRKGAAPVAYCEPMVDVAQRAREASPPPTSAAGCTPRTELERSPAPRSADGGASARDDGPVATRRSRS